MLQYLNIPSDDPIAAVSGYFPPMNETPTKNNNNRAPFFITLIFALIVGFFWTGWPVIRRQMLAYSPSITATLTSPVASNTITAPKGDVPPAISLAEATFELQPTPNPNDRKEDPGVIVFSMSDGSFKHLFALNPQTMVVSRLTDHPWDDIHPALSPDGSRLAFSSRRNRYWNLYILDLHSGELTQVTDTFEYEGAPSWSPDGQWLAYETYAQGNLDIYVQSIQDLTQPPIQLTNGPSADHSPAWSPKGRKIAFVSNRNGDEEIWAAHLDQVEDRFTNLTNNPGSSDLHPNWSPDGRYLAWTGRFNDADHIRILDTENPQLPPSPPTIGTYPVWSPSGDALLIRQGTIGQVSLSAFQVTGNQLALPFTLLPGEIFGMDWDNGQAKDLLQSHYLQSPAQPPVLWDPILTLAPQALPGRYGIVEIPDVNVEFPYLHDAVDESFQALRREAGRQSGWDLLGNLEYAYLPITEAPNPGNVDEWLLTGRAFALNPLPIQAGWMAIVREDISGQVYWRMYIRTRFQDGSQGQPMKAKPWLLEARFSNDPRMYEQGGTYGDIPEGYWIDFTELASRYGWLPVPALHNWRTYHQAARFNQFVWTDGLSWEAAMAQLYPPEALVLPTIIPSLTITPSLTPTIRFFRSVTPLPSPTSTPLPAFRPTWTPLPGG